MPQLRSRPREVGDVVGLGIDPEAQASCTGSLTPSGLPAPDGGTAVVPQGLTVGGAYVGS